MLITEFIDKSFETISMAFPQALLQYQFDNRVSTHYIKVSPPYIYEEPSFTDLFWELDDLFEEFFPEETLCFLTEDSLIQLDNPSRTRLPFWAIRADNSEVLYQEILTLKNEPDQTSRIYLSVKDYPTINLATPSPVDQEQAFVFYKYAMAA